jgi:hypothetical protein
VSDGAVFGFNGWAPSASPATSIATLSEYSGIFLGEISARSTCTGESVASVTSPVTVDTNGAKIGYIPAPNGLDSITIESSMNARQILSSIQAASAGVIVGAGTGTIVIKRGTVSVKQIAASNDNAGNRNSVSLTLPP